MKNKKVKYDGHIYAIIFDYKNGLYEIQSIQNPYHVLLVSDKEISEI